MNFLGGEPLPFAFVLEGVVGREISCVLLYPPGHQIKLLFNKKICLCGFRADTYQRGAHSAPVIGVSV